MKAVEFFYFYLMPEAVLRVDGGGSDGFRQRSPSKAFGRSGMMVEGTKTTEEKQGLLGRYLDNVADLVEDLRESAPFGAAVA